MPEYDPKPIALKRRKNPRTKFIGVRAFQRHRPRLAALLQAVQVEEIKKEQQMIERVKEGLRSAEKLYNECIIDFIKYRNRMHLLRRKSLKALKKLRFKIADLARTIRSRDVLLARMEHEAKVGRLLNSNTQTLENLARAYLSEGEWDMVQKKRRWYAKNALTRKLRAAARKAGGEAAVVVTNNGNTQTQV